MSNLQGDLRKLKNPEKEMRRTIPFTRLLVKLFDGSVEWRTVTYGRWAYPSHITLGETRTVVKLARLLALTVSAHRSVAVSFQDNQPCAGAAGKGRSASFELNVLLRQRTAAKPAAQIRMILPWVESGRQPADDISRIIDV